MDLFLVVVSPLLKAKDGKQSQFSRSTVVSRYCDGTPNNEGPKRPDRRILFPEALYPETDRQSIPDRSSST